MTLFKKLSTNNDRKRILFYFIKFGILKSLFWHPFRYVTFFATRASPTEAIMVLWEARNREATALSNLKNTLRGMGRYDAAAVLEDGVEVI